jgi:membrane protein implicated in regulation of membrane protease activity
MFALLSSPLLWAVLAVLLAVLELGTAGFIAGFLAVGSFVTMFLVHFGVATTPLGILLAFVLSTLVGTAILWMPLTKFYKGRKTTDETEGLVNFIGSTGTVASDELTTNGGTIRVHGARMEAVLANGLTVTTLPAGTLVKVTARDTAQRLVVEPAA